MKGIPNTLRASWPSSHSHRYYLRHIKDNFQKNFKDKALHILLWEVGCASDSYVYKAKRAKLKASCEDANT